jgi:hypothetical protein
MILDAQKKQGIRKLHTLQHSPVMPFVYLIDVMLG